MLAALLTAVVVHGALASPWRSTPWQRELLNGLQDDARHRSDIAAPALEEVLSGGEFRSALRDCAGPDLAELPAAELAQRLREEVATVEVVSGFRADGFEMSLSEAIHGPGFFESSWQVRVRQGQNFSGGERWYGIQDDVETKVYGFRPFSHHGYPQIMPEASERTPYFMANLFRVDVGSPLYGDVSVVLKPSLAAEAGVVSCADTGGWTGMCNSSDTSWMPDGYKPKCSAYKKSNGLGTLTSFDHLLLANAAYWRVPLSRVACRLLAPWGQTPLVGSDLIHYLEVMPAAELTFPSAVKFVIGSFPDLFGTSTGAKLQEWCATKGWVLLWSLGLNLGDDEGPANFWTAVGLGDEGAWTASNRRVVDPVVLARTSAAFNGTSPQRPSPQGLGAKFEAAWQGANVTRRVAAAANHSVSNVTWALSWSNLMELLPADLRMLPLQAGFCSDIENCVGTSPSGDCLCYRGGIETAEVVI